ncbi:hypothetical protein GmHk_16G045325 [Glycine max]|nr:hypothetical protein GmHk_16G045325 [Glycine max]
MASFHKYISMQDVASIARKGGGRDFISFKSKIILARRGLIHTMQIQNLMHARDNDCLMEVRHCLKELLLEHLTWNCGRYGTLVKGDRMRNVGVVDSEYIVHLGLPTHGGSNGNEASPGSPGDNRSKVRMQSYIEMQVFGKRWKDAAEKDKCWIDPYAQENKTSH